jgi:hypothetical protein
MGRNDRVDRDTTKGLIVDHRTGEDRQDLFQHRQPVRPTIRIRRRGLVIARGDLARYLLAVLTIGGWPIGP